MALAPLPPMNIRFINAIKDFGALSRAANRIKVDNSVYFSPPLQNANRTFVARAFYLRVS
jgi:hypothetical protein